MSVDRTPDERKARIAAMADALANAFDDRAIDVAVRQRDLAEEDVAATWDAIVVHLREMRP
jgi:hypothetical protein